MDHKLKLRVMWQEQLSDPWNLNNEHVHLDGWHLNSNKVLAGRHRLELGKEFGVISLPHRERRFNRLANLDN